VCGAVINGKGYNNSAGKVVKFYAEADKFFNKNFGS
jgi:hypothetical protein